MRRTFSSSLSTEEQTHPHGVRTDVVKKPLENQQEEPFQEYSHTEVFFSEKKGPGDVGMSPTKSRSVQSFSLLLH